MLLPENVACACYFVGGLPFSWHGWHNCVQLHNDPLTCFDSNTFGAEGGVVHPVDLLFWRVLRLASISPQSTYWRSSYTFLFCLCTVLSNVVLFICNVTYPNSRYRQGMVVVRMKHALYKTCFSLFPSKTTFAICWWRPRLQQLFENLETPSYGAMLTFILCVFLPVGRTSLSLWKSLTAVLFMYYAHDGNPSTSDPLLTVVYPTVSASRPINTTSAIVDSSPSLLATSCNRISTPLAHFWSCHIRFTYKRAVRHSC